MKLGHVLWRKYFLVYTQLPSGVSAWRNSGQIALLSTEVTRWWFTTLHTRAGELYWSILAFSEPVHGDSKHPATQISTLTAQIWHGHTACSWRLMSRICDQILSFNDEVHMKAPTANVWKYTVLWIKRTWVGPRHVGSVFPRLLKVPHIYLEFIQKCRDRLVLVHTVTVRLIISVKRPWCHYCLESAAAHDILIGLKTQRNDHLQNKRRDVS